jgi:hypothetical protein
VDTMADVDSELEHFAAGRDELEFMGLVILT